MDWFSRKVLAWRLSNTTDADFCVAALEEAIARHGRPDIFNTAVGQKDWSPKSDGTPIRLVRFTDRLLAEKVETHPVEGVPVKVFGITKTIADCFRYRNKIGLSVAIEGLQEALRQRKATPGEIAKQAERGAVGTVIRPYLEALTANG